MTSQQPTPEAVEAVGRCSCGPYAIVMGEVPDPGCPFHGDKQQEVQP